MVEDEEPELRAAVSSSLEKIIVRVLSMDRLIKPALCVLCSLVLHVAPASASPSEVSQYLMRTPVSMMTYGVNELSHLLNEEPKTLAVGNIFVKYDYDADIIRIEPWCFRCGLEATEEACGKLINEIRSYAQVSNGKPLVPDGSSFSFFFKQTGYGPADEPKELRQQIDKMFVISVFIIQENAGPKPPEDHSIKCEAPLLGTSYSVKHP
jgi:hypothetical protein